MESFEKLAGSLFQSAFANIDTTEFQSVLANIDLSAFANIDTTEFQSVLANIDLSDFSLPTNFNIDLGQIPDTVYENVLDSTHVFAQASEIMGNNGW